MSRKNCFPPSIFSLFTTAVRTGLVTLTSLTCLQGHAQIPIEQPSDCVSAFHSTHLFLYDWLKVNGRHLKLGSADPRNFTEEFLRALDSKSLKIIPNHQALKYKGQDVSALFDGPAGNQIAIRCDRFMTEKSRKSHFRLVAHEIFRKMEYAAHIDFEGDAYKISSQIPDVPSLKDNLDPEGVRIIATMPGLETDFDTLARETQTLGIYKLPEYLPEKAPAHFMRIKFELDSKRSHLPDPATWKQEVPKEKFPLEFALEFSEVNDLYLNLNLTEVKYKGGNLGAPHRYIRSHESTSPAVECGHLWVFSEFEICLSLTNTSGLTRLKKLAVRGTLPSEIALGKNRPHYFLYELGGFTYAGEESPIHRSSKKQETFEHVASQMVALQYLVGFSTKANILKIASPSANQMNVTFSPTHTIPYNSDTVGKAPLLEPLEFTLNISEGPNQEAIYRISHFVVNNQTTEAPRLYFPDQTNGSRDCSYLWRAYPVEVCLKTNFGIIQKLEIIKLGKDQRTFKDARLWFNDSLGEERYFGHPLNRDK